MKSVFGCKTFRIGTKDLTFSIIINKGTHLGYNLVVFWQINCLNF